MHFLHIYTVKTWHSHTQGTIIGVILSNMYTRKIEAIGKMHKSIYMYANDTQCYFGFNINTPIETVQNKIKNLILDLN